MIESLITGAAIGIIGCLGGQGVMLKLQKADSLKLSERVTELETKELIVKDEDYIGRAEIQELMNGFAAQTQQALNDQYTALAQQVMMSQEQTAKAVRVSEARTRSVAASVPPQQPSAADMQQMMDKFADLQRQIGG